MAELYHHGILNMHWGVRNGPPYPLGSNISTGKKLKPDAKGVRRIPKEEQKVKDKSMPRGINARDAILKTEKRIQKSKKRKLFESDLYYNNRTKREFYNIIDTSPLRNDTVFIKKGTELKRTSLKEKEDSNERIYAALPESSYDMDYYSKTWPSYLKKISGNPNVKVYQNSYEVQAHIIAPSRKTRKEIAATILSSNKKMMEEFGKVYTLDQLRIKTGNFGAKTLKDIENSTARENQELLNIIKKNNPDSPLLKSLKKQGKTPEKMAKDYVRDQAEAYDKLVKSLDVKSDAAFKRFNAVIPTSPKLMTVYQKELQKQGYNAVFDDNSDSPAPFIVFDQSMLKQTGSQRIA